MPTSYQENAALVARVKSGDRAAAEALLALNERLCFSIANKYRAISGSLELDDLVIEAKLGLLRAAETFDPARGQFSTWATVWAKQHIARAVEAGGHAIKTPDYAQAKRRQAGEEPLPPVVSLDGPVGDDGFLLSDLLPAFTCDPSTMAINSSFIASGLALLTTRERQIVQRRYGLSGFHQETLAETAAAMRMSREGVRQAEARALRRLQEYGSGTRPGKGRQTNPPEARLARHRDRTRALELGEGLCT